MIFPQNPFTLFVFNKDIKDLELKKSCNFSQVFHYNEEKYQKSFRIIPEPRTASAFSGV